MIVWMTFILVPIFIGGIMMIPKYLEARERYVLLSQIAGTTALLVFLLTAFIQFDQYYETVHFYQFVVGCIISIVVNLLVQGKNSGRW